VKAKTLEVFLVHLAELKLPLPETEVAFCETREWRFDFCWRIYKLALEVDGGGPRDRGGIGRHQDPRTRQDDMDKHNAATLLRWHVLHVTTPDVERGTAAKAVHGFIRGGLHGFLAGRAGGDDPDDRAKYLHAFMPEYFNRSNSRRFR